MKPILIVPEGQMSAEAIKTLNENGICTVEAKEPGLIKFVDPIPAISSRTEIENAAIKLSRFLISESNDYNSLNKKDVIKFYVDFLVKGTPLGQGGTKEDQDKRAFDAAKRMEFERLAREEAKAEREAAKQKKFTAEQKAKLGGKS